MTGFAPCLNCTKIGDYGDVTNAADKLFGIIYKWLDKQEGLDKDVLQDVFASCLPPVDG